MKTKADMEETPLISIIVPVYQVKAYINMCVESLLTQTYKNLEILLVDDGSTDGSGAMCDEYAARDDRVRVIHQENQGPSTARNRGLDEAGGAYVAFMDADDVALPEWIETLYDLLKKYQADIAACDYIEFETDDAVSAGKGLADQEREACICMTSGQMLRRWHGKYKRWETVVWNKLYRKSVFGGAGETALRFPVGRKLEDVLISHRIVDNAAKIVLTKRRLYQYRIRPESRAWQSRTAEHGAENLRAQRERMAFFKERRYRRAYLNLLKGYALHRMWFAWKRVFL